MNLRSDAHTTCSQRHQKLDCYTRSVTWVPAFAGMTFVGSVALPPGVTAAEAGVWSTGNGVMVQYLVAAHAALGRIALS